MSREPLDGIAVIGLAGRFPQAPDIEQFWRNLCDGVESVSFFSDAELEAAGVTPAQYRDPRYVRGRAALQDAELFDPGFFALTPREAEFTDPQIRIFLECAWEALESAGWNPESYPGMIGVYAGMSFSSYIWQLAAGDSVEDSVSAFQTLVGGAEKDHLATSTSYRLNLRGPSINVQTACSTSLTAVHIASRALMTFECDMALAGGASVAAPVKAGYMYEPGGIASADGHCRSFDARATGSVAGDGVGVVLLKRLEDAVTAGDTVYAVIKGSAVNNDGRRKVGFTAPAIEGQAEAIAMALNAAEVEPREIGYVEAHGSATALGDPIEVSALNQVYASAGLAPGSVLLGSVKSNIGHLGAAAGIAGFIKAVLAVHHGKIPASVNFKDANPKIPFERGPFRVARELTPWPAGQSPRRAGVSSFGIGGTNVHVVLEEPPKLPASDPAKPWQLVTASARSKAALERSTDQLAENLRRNPDLNFADVAFTLQQGRKAFDHRRMAVCPDLQMATEWLQSRNPAHVSTAAAPSNRRPVAFLLPGLGDQYVDMGRGLYESEPEFARHVDECCRVLRPLLGLDLRGVMYPAVRVREQSSAPVVERLNFRDLVARNRQQESAAPAELQRTLLAQPALFVIEYALARLWMSQGIVPEALLGYSLGEYTAACLAGVISLEDSLRLLAERARRIEDLPAGAMLAIAAPENKVSSLLSHGISMAGINGPSLCVVAGAPEAIDSLQLRLTSEGGPVCRRLQASHAFHSPLMEPVADALTRIMRSVPLSAPKIPYISNVTGRWITTAQATDPEYWTRHLCRPVQFAEGLKQICSPAPPVFLEVGPGQMLSGLAEQYLAGEGIADRVTLPSLPHSSDRHPDRAFFLQTMGNLWLAGVDPDWAAVHEHERRARVPLPTYPFERKAYWRSPVRRTAAAVESGKGGSSAEETRAAVREEDTHPTSRAHIGAEYVAARNSTEQRVVEIWEDLLGVRPVGVHDEFLRLGGNSLLAIRVAADLREAFEIEFPLKALLSASTIADIAQFIEDALLTMIEGMNENEVEEIEKK